MPGGCCLISNKQLKADRYFLKGSQRAGEVLMYASVLDEAIATAQTLPALRLYDGEWWLGLL